METVRTVLAGAGSPVASDSDALALAVHAALEHDGLRCISTDESKASSAPATVPARTNPLPETWNKSQDVYSFFYRHESSPALVVVKSLVMDETMLVHAASDKADDVHTLELRQISPSKSETQQHLIGFSIVTNIWCGLVDDEIVLKRVHCSHKCSNLVSN